METKLNSFEVNVKTKWVMAWTSEQTGTDSNCDFNSPWNRMYEYLKYHYKFQKMLQNLVGANKDNRSIILPFLFRSNKIRYLRNGWDLISDSNSLLLIQSSFRKPSWNWIFKLTQKASNLVKCSTYLLRSEYIKKQKSVGEWKI